MFIVTALSLDLGWSQKTFLTVDELEDWLNNVYFCKACKAEIEEEMGPGPWVWRDMMGVVTGCECEIKIE